MLLIGMIASCSRDSREDDAESDDVVISFDDQVLTMTDILSRMPSGIDGEDSVALVEGIADNWLEERLLEDAALDNIGDDARIEKMVADYRRRLLVAEYRKRVRASISEKNIASDSLKAYYMRHVEEYRLDRPVVKGVFVKMPAASEWVDDVRRWLAAADQRSIDKLEKHALADALQYEFFADTWQDWEAISNQIPYHFADADAFVKSHRDFETTYGSNIYFLHIGDFLPSGSPMPYEIAAVQIKVALADAARGNSEKQIILSLRQRAEKEGRLKYNLPSINNPNPHHQ